MLFYYIQFTYLFELNTVDDRKNTIQYRRSTKIDTRITQKTIS